MNLKKMVSMAGTVFLSASILLTGCAGGSKGTSNGSTNNSASTAPGQASTMDTKLTGGLVMPLSKEKVTLTWQMEENPTFPVNENNWYILDEIEKITNIRIKIQPVPNSNYNDKLAIQIASGSLPDIATSPADKAIDAGMEGIVLKLDDYMSKMPNLTGFLAQDPLFKPAVLAPDGKMYGFPMQTQTYPTHCWLYRADIMEKEGLKIPNTMDEYINVLRELKKKYPGQTPYTSRIAKEGGNNFPLGIASVFATSYGLAEDLFIMKNGKALFTPEQPQFKKLVQDLITMYNEKLIDQDYPLVNTNMWQERVQLGKSFITMDWYTRMTTFNDNNTASKNPISGFKMIRVRPPVPAGGEGKLPGLFPLKSKVMVVSKNVKNPEVAMKLVDFFYSPKGVEITGWGVEGKTWERNEKGGYNWTKNIQNWNNPDKSLPDVKMFGVYNEGIYLRIKEFKPNDIGEVPDIQEWRNYMDKEKLIAPAQPVLPQTADEKTVWSEKYTNIKKYYQENIDKFVMGKRPISEYDAFIAECKKLGSDQLVQQLQGRYDKVSKK